MNNNMKYLILILLALILIGCPKSSQQPTEMPETSIDSSDTQPDTVKPEEIKRFGE